MKRYAQFCPVAKAAELFCERWTPLIIRDLAWGSTRFSELQRGVPLMSPTLLSRRLKQLEAEGVVERRPQANRRGWTYHLTEAGREFIPLIDTLGVWGQRWTRRDLADNEMNLGLLLWSIERRAKANAFGKYPAVVRLAFTDLPAGQNIWWFVNQDGHCELCLDDPGFEVDLYLSCTLPDMIRIVRGDLPLKEALASERLEAIGTSAARRRLTAWLNLSPLTGVKSVHTR
ncbi:winged helix-turn-helix transcriptional regulator [Mesorhizobium xinjiangense]|uniref:winged helix-turn-helix transcriptional regulator n=1 Tax=Mesorhizobium xinjiangense TaxID=2678685 RepID=UPI0012EE36F8|nr:helix-turn-helix domain-containing protein [Mesorhizobium xinjiangense]